jgi:DNA modification methylase
MNTLYLGDNLPILKTIPDESVDLVYIDPPFNSNRNYSGIIKSKTGDTSSNNSTILAQFEDTWKGGMKTYIHEFMYPIVQEIHRILKPTGSLFFHCDHSAQAYIQVQILDPIFGVSSLRNIIAWLYTGPSAPKQRQFSRKHDHIFWYSKGENWTFNANDVRVPYVRTEGVGNIKSGSWGKFDKKLDDGKIPEDYWFFAIAPFCGKERTGYPTQKPEKLLERIILASSNEGDTVLDCFMGSGTTVVVADKLKRNWIGIDQSPVSLAVAKSRLSLNQDLFNTSSYSTVTAKWDYDVLRNMDDFEFEKLMVTKLTGTPSKATKGGDMGIDGIVNSKTVISVKRSDGIGRNVVDNLQTATKRHRRDPKAMDNSKENYIIKIQKGEINLSDYDAVVVAFSFGKGTYSEVVDMKIQDGFNILLLTVEDILPVAKPPKVGISVEDKTKTDGFWLFTATTTNKIENYSWSIRENKSGEIIASESLSTEPTFGKAINKKSDYTISVEVVDENGLSGNNEVVVSVV